MEAASENNYEKKKQFCSKMTLSLWHNDTIRPALLMLDASAMLLCSKLFGYSVYA